MACREQQFLDLMHSDADVLIVGAGPAGLAAAVSAAQLGARILLCEGRQHPGRKLLLTGNGRCNVTFDAPPAQLVSHYRPNGRFLYPALNALPPDALRSLLRESGAPTVADAAGRVFPESERSHTVLNAWLKLLQKHKVALLTNQRVQNLLFSADRQVIGVETQQQTWYAQAVILSTGGCAHPLTGSDGSGYQLAESAGHTITPLAPALAPLNGLPPWLRGLAGLSVNPVRLTVASRRRKAAAPSRVGSLLLTHQGLSGPVALDFSRELAGLSDHPLLLAIDWLPENVDSAWLAALTQAGLDAPKRRLSAYRQSGLPQRLWQALLEHLGLADRLLRDLSQKQRETVLQTLHRTVIPVRGVAGWDAAMATRGGVDLAEIDPRTLASRRMPGLYLAGELLDLDADSGGFMLQMAFSTGWLAGQAAAEFCRAGG